MSKKFDDDCRMFTSNMLDAADWKHNFLGSAYSTRIREAIKFARAACDQAEKAMDEDDEGLEQFLII